MSKIIVAKHAGFCFGVARAVDTVNGIIGTYDHIYTYGELIHNKDVVESLSGKGVLVTEDIDSVPQLASTLIIIRSHGVSGEVYEKIKERGYMPVCYAYP